MSINNEHTCKRGSPLSIVQYDIRIVDTRCLAVQKKNLLIHSDLYFVIDDDEKLYVWGFHISSIPQPS